MTSEPEVFVSRDGRLTLSTDGRLEITIERGMKFDNDPLPPPCPTCGLRSNT